MKKILGLILSIALIFGIMPQMAFAATKVTTFNITVTAPKEGEMPVNSATLPETASTYAEKVEWSGEFDANGCFKVGASYTVVVTVRIKPNQDKELAVLKGRAKINGNEGELYYISDDKQQGSIRYTFAPVVSSVVAKPTVDEFGNCSFTDVSPDDYYAAAVNWAIKEGITSGTSATTFSPDATCTRAQILTFLWRANGSPKYEGPNNFLDVSESDYYYDAANWADSKTLVSSTKFKGDEPCTRSSTIFYLWKLAGCPKNFSSYSEKFTDVQRGTNQADNVGWAVASGITSGTSETTFSPNATCTRGQIVTFLLRASLK